MGTFPGAALNLPGGSPFGYSPTDDSYCLFATQPYSGAPTPAALLPGSPLPAPESLPGAFACVDASSNPTASAQSFTVSYGGKNFVCQGAPGLSPSPLPLGRKLQQAPSPAEAAIGNALETVSRNAGSATSCSLVRVLPAAHSMLAGCADWVAHLELRGCNNSRGNNNLWPGN